MLRRPRHTDLSLAPVLFLLAACANAPSHPAVRRDDVPHATEDAYPLAFHRGYLWLWARRPETADTDPAYAFQRWLWGREVSLLRLDIRDGSVREALADEHLQAVHQTSADELFVLTTTGPELHLWRRVDDRFVNVHTMPATQDEIFALSDWEGRPVMLASHVVHFFDRDGTFRSTPYALKTFGHASHVVVTAEGILYGGSSAREDTGDLFRLSLTSGAAQHLCSIDYSLKTMGDPNHCRAITGLIPDPEMTACLLASNGSWHELERGRMQRICGDTVSEIPVPGLEPLKYSGEMGCEEVFQDRCESMRARPDEPAQSPGISGLTWTRRGYWLTTHRAVYFVRQGHATKVALPSAFEHRGMHLSVIPGAIIVTYPGERYGSDPYVCVTSFDGPGALLDSMAPP